MSRPHPATRLAALVLGLVSGMMAQPMALAVMLFLVTLGMAWTGLGLGRQLAAQKPWATVAALVLGVHTLTTVEAAPLGHPSWLGLAAGVQALARVGLSVGLLGLYLRVASLDDLIAGTGWWLAPLQRVGVPVSDLGLMLAVALGTAPVVLGEGRRIEMVVRLRRAGGTEAGFWLSRWVRRIVDRAQVVVPLLETLGRRAEALSLSLRRRRPEANVHARFLPPGEILFLSGWLAMLIWSPWS